MTKYASDGRLGTMATKAKDRERRMSMGGCESEEGEGASANADRAGGPADLSRDASQPKALIPSAEMGHKEALDAIIGCASTTALLSYQEAIEGYLQLRGIRYA